MDWWNELTDWTSSDNGWRVLSGAIIPFVAIVVAGIIAALIGRGATKRVVAMQERESRNAAVAGVVSAARKAATWGSLGHDERSYADHLAEDADIRLRLLPVSGAPLAANWAQHEIADIKKNSSTFSFQADQSLAEFRDRMLEWQARPNRAKKLFKADLERWKFDSPDPDAELIARQQDWSADQQDRREQDRPSAPAPTAERPTPTTTGLRPASQQPGGTPSPAAPVASSAAQAPAPASAATPAATSAPWSARSGSEGATTTRAYGEGETTPLDGAPIRPALGSPVASRNDVPQRPAASVDRSDDDAVDDRADDRTADRSVDRSDDVRPASALRIASPTAADAHVNRATASGYGASTTNTTSIPTRVADAPAEPKDSDETDESPYTQPISASELRRRAADDED